MQRWTTAPGALAFGLMTSELIVLRVVHILGGIFWVGGALISTLFLVPALSTLGPTAGQVFAALQKRKMMTTMFASSVLSILSGLRLLWITSGGMSSAYLATPVGRTFAWSGAIALVAFLIGVLVARPSGMRMGQIGAQMASAPAEEKPALVAELERLRRRNGMASVTVTTLLVLATVGMAVARYVG
jgi:uncharacterized membrane protein